MISPQTGRVHVSAFPFRTLSSDIRYLSSIRRLAFLVTRNKHLENSLRLKCLLHLLTGIDNIKTTQTLKKLMLSIEWKLFDKLILLTVSCFLLVLPRYFLCFFNCRIYCHDDNGYVLSACKDSLTSNMWQRRLLSKPQVNLGVRTENRLMSRNFPVFKMDPCFLALKSD